VFVVVAAHAVADPETVVVVSFDAHLTLAAVSGAVVACDLADSACDLFWFMAADQFV
jgi:hypothetical protein